MHTDYSAHTNARSQKGMKSPKAKTGLQQFCTMIKAGGSALDLVQHGTKADGWMHAMLFAAV